MTDPIADMLTRIRNGLIARHDAVTIPTSKLKLEIGKILVEEGYLADLTEHPADAGKGTFTLGLKYESAGRPVIREIKRISKPSLRQYAGATELPEVLSGLGVAIVTTSKGVMTADRARKAGVGGEVLCSVY